ncbi:polyphosphate kinase [Sphingomonas sp. LY29]|uniref:polyphosphate kinase 2 family protein n=1 Tax=Sphingomonas sp. LY29 TaxID=3095341 RepID=UPI002D79897B|nr:polyphosphate kinase [Sphingomonas sp. LY29]WRP25993.1 polyphosphate kinase [Sphingomonas sp. LY29]
MSIDLTKFERGQAFDGDASAALAGLQARLARLQLSQIVHRRRAIILVEGWIGAGKKAALRRMVGAWDPSHLQVVRVAAQEADDHGRHWLAPFWGSLPAAGDTSIFYRSWYRRIVADRLYGALDDKRWARACDEVNEFESQQRDHGTLLVKLFFHVSGERQLAVLRERQEDEWRRHLLSEEDVAGLGQRERTTEILHDLFAQTDTRWAPWTVIDAADEMAGSLAALTAVADQMQKAFPQSPPAQGDTVIHFPHKKLG